MVCLMPLVCAIAISSLYVIGLALILAGAALAARRARLNVEATSKRVARINELHAAEGGEKVALGKLSGPDLQEARTPITAKYREIREREGLPSGTYGAVDPTGEAAALRAIRIVADGNAGNAILAAVGAGLQTVASILSLVP